MINIMKWYGSKLKLLDRILAYIDKDSFSTFVDVFCGSGNVTMAVKGKFKDKTYIVNDTNRSIITFFKVCQDSDKFKILLRRLRWTAFGDIEHRIAFDIIHDNLILEKKVNDIDLAWAFFVYHRMSFAGCFQTTSLAGLGVDRKNKTNFAAEFHNKVDILEEYRKQLKNITFLNRDYTKIIDMYKENKNSMLFLDPPYIKSVSNIPYKVKLNGEFITWGKEEEEKLFLSLNDLKGHFILTYDNIPDSIKDKYNVEEINETAFITRGKKKKKFCTYIVTGLVKDKKQLQSVLF